VEIHKGFKLGAVRYKKCVLDDHPMEISKNHIGIIDDRNELEQKIIINFIIDVTKTIQGQKQVHNEK